MLVVSCDGSPFPGVQGVYSGGGDHVRRSRRVRERKDGQGKRVVEERGQRVRRQGGGRPPFPIQCVQMIYLDVLGGRVSRITNFDTLVYYSVIR